jgi:CRISPR/Cas system Type II protein with McrA/HNH and RuvC-like nuclease domain
MNYKTYLKNDEEISIKLRIIKHRIIDKWEIKEISNYYSMHRNTVTNIMNTYNSNVSLYIKEKIDNNISLSSHDLKNNCNFLLSKSTRPKSHSKQASLSEEKDIVKNFELLKV